MKEKLYQKLDTTIERSADKIEIIASDERLDRQGDVLKLSDWDLREFRKAPRLMVDHDHRVSKIVGKATNIRIKDKKLVFIPEFHGITQLSKDVEAMVKAGHLDTVSVGFIPHGPKKDGGSDSNELIEISFVTVPANPNARIRTLLDEDETKEESMAIKSFVEKEVEDEVTTPDEKTMTVKEAQELLEKQGMVIITTDKYSELVGDSKKLKTLTNSNKGIKPPVGVSQLDVSKEALKEASKIINHALCITNKANIKK